MNKNRPTIADVLAAHAAYTHALARLPNATTRAERDELHVALGTAHSVLLSAAAYHEPTEPQPTIEPQLNPIPVLADYTRQRIAQLQDQKNMANKPTLAATIDRAHIMFHNMHILLGLAGGDEYAALLTTIEALAIESFEGVREWSDRTGIHPGHFEAYAHQWDGGNGS
jgi:hypothetical protein